MCSQSVTKNKVLLGMSGGLDSTMAALFLKEAGYSVIGLTLKTWHRNPGIMEQSVAKAKEMAEKLAIEHHVLDLQKSFKKEVVDYFCREYMTGRTPNPCNRCNPVIKWPALLQKADESGCRHIATGHYVQKQFLNNRWYIKKGADPSKDQSYFLWNLDQNILKRALFPLGQLSKEKVRELALNTGFKEAARLKESMGVCFLDGTDYRDFIVEQNGLSSLRPGNIVDETGKILGKHRGLAFFTIGQKKGLGLPGNKYFVVRLDDANNQVVVSKSASLKTSKIYLSSYYLSYPPSAKEEHKVDIRIRGIDSVPTIPGTLKIIQTKGLEVNFDHPAWGITPGQSIVFYLNDVVIGGGII
jgi:tRNA-specific 2-thiouridylase